MKYVRMGPIYNNPVQIMAWGRTGDKPLSEPMIAYFGDAYMRLSASNSFKIKYQSHKQNLLTSLSEAGILGIDE